MKKKLEKDFLFYFIAFQQWRVDMGCGAWSFRSFFRAG